MDKEFLNPVINGISNGAKLTNTVYRLLEFFPESDPLKNRAKDKALAIMEHLTLLNETRRLPAGRQGWATFADVFSEEKIKVKLVEDIDILLGYLWIGKSQGWLNSVNCLITSNEYEKIKNDIKQIIGPVKELTQKLPGIDLPSQVLRSEISEGESPTIEQKTQITADPVLNNTGVEDDMTPSFDKAEFASTKALARQEKILGFLAKNEKAQVMDLMAILPNITKRTIRRDLYDLLQGAKIIRAGSFNQVSYKLA